MMTQAQNFRRQLQRNTAQTVLALCKTEGIVFTYQDTTNPPSPVTLYGINGPETRTIQDDGVIEEEHTMMRLTVPRQYIGNSCGYGDPNLGLLFPPPEFRAPGTNEPSIYGQVVYNNHNWSVDSWTCDSVEAVYYLKIIRHQAKRTTRI